MQILATSKRAPVAALRFPPLLSGSTWSTVAQALWGTVERARGRYLAGYPSGDGVTMTHAPRLTNGDVVTIVMAWLAAIGVSGARHRQVFPLWSQFAAAAYGWDPKTNRFDATAKRAASWYPDVLLVELWKAQSAIAADLDADGVPMPRIDLDGRFSDVVFQGEVMTDLKADGASALFKIPVPLCKGSDGKMRPMKCRRVMKSWPYLCEEFEKCQPVLVDDPVTIVKDKATSFGQLALLVGAFWLLFNNQPRHRRRLRA